MKILSFFQEKKHKTRSTTDNNTIFTHVTDITYMYEISWKNKIFNFILYGFGLKVNFKICT